MNSSNFTLMLKHNATAVGPLTFRCTPAPVRNRSVFCSPRSRQELARRTHIPRAATAAVASTHPVPKRLAGFWSTLISEQLSSFFPGLDPKAAYLISHGVGHLLLPLLEAWLVLWLMRKLAAGARAWCEANQERPLFTEVVGLLPAAIEGPTVFTVTVMAVLRLLHNAVFLAANYVMIFQRKYNKAVDHLIENFCSVLVPLDKALIKTYSVIMIFFLCTVLVKWKSIGLAFILEKERERQEAEILAAGGNASKVRSTDELERLLVPLDAVSSWLLYSVAIIGCAQVLGFDIAPLVAVGGAGSIIIGLATQQLLTNAVMGLSLFFTRPFVDGDSVQVQAAGGILLGGVVEKTTVMRTTLRTEDDVIVTIPNKIIADMVVYNKSANITRSRLARANRATDKIKLRLKLPYAAEDKLKELQEIVLAVLEPKPDSGAQSDDGSRSGSPESSMSEGSRPPSPSRRGWAGMMPLSKSIGASKPAAVKWSHPVVANSVEVQLSRFTDSGIELLVKAKLRADPSSQQVQDLMLDLSGKVRQLGAMMVNV